MTKRLTADGCSKAVPGSGSSTNPTPQMQMQLMLLELVLPELLPSPKSQIPLERERPDAGRRRRTTRRSSHLCSKTFPLL
jgi:hypothetical protein